MKGPDHDRRADPARPEACGHLDSARELTAAKQHNRPPFASGRAARKHSRTAIAHEPLPKLLTAKQVEELTQINVKTLYGYVRRGRIPYVRIQSNVRFPLEEIREWLERQTFRPF